MAANFIGTLGSPSNLVGTLNNSSATALTGTLGSTLIRGYSAYEIAKQNGFNGTVEEWLSSFTGQSVGVKVLTDTINEYVLEFTTSEGTVVTPNLRAAPVIIEPITNRIIDSIFSS